jgi:histone arginine demethylase JMJD6
MPAGPTPVLPPAVAPAPAAPLPAASPSAATVDRRPGISRADFERDYRHASRPVVLPDLIGAWTAQATWTPTHLRARLADRVLEIRGRPWRFGDFIDRLLAADPARPAPYLNQEVIARTFPELLADLQPWPWCFSPNWLPGLYPTRFVHEAFNRAAELELFIGAAGSGLHVLHYDYLHTHAFSVQLYGRKRFYLYPPGQATLLYAEGNLSAVDDVVTPDLGRFPLFAKAVPLVLDLAPGEILFLPCGWWHDTRLLSDSISVSIGTACSSNWRQLSQDACAHTCARYRPLVRLSLATLGCLRRLRRG